MGWSYLNEIAPGRLETSIPEGLAVIVVGFAVGRLELSPVVAEKLEVENDGWRESGYRRTYVCVLKGILMGSWIG